MAACSTNDDLTPIESALHTLNQQALRTGAPSRTVQGSVNQFTRPQTLDTSPENAGQLKKKAGSTASRKRLEDLTHQLGVYSSRPSMASQDITSNQVTFLNSAHSTERLVDERLQKVGMHVQFSKVEEQNQSLESDQETAAMAVQQAADQTPVSDASPRTAMESFGEMQVEVVDKSEKAHQYFVLGLNGAGEMGTQEHAQASKKQRKACGFKTRFSDYTKNVLEHAYEFNAEGSPGRKHLEAGIVKKLSDKCGISHEQVKQWVRNRNKKVRRRCQISEAELDLRGDNENMDTSYQFGRVREDNLRPSFTLNQ